jgi:uncharacterized protein (DUF1330 family)
MQSKISIYLATVTAFLFGIVIGGSSFSFAKPATQNDTQKPAYLVFSGNILHPDKLEPYVTAALPLAEAAGLEYLSQAHTPQDIQVLEGEWPYTGALYIERFSSMKALKDFWFSDGYQEAIKLREKHLDVDFIIAVEGNE